MTFSWGTHFYQFYETGDDLIDVLIPYFKAGLENNEFCMWVTSPPLTAEEATEVFGGASPELDDYLAKRQMEILDHSEWYLRSGRFDPGAVLNGWVDRMETAIQNGFDGLRLTGNTYWLEDADWKDFSHYERTVDDVIGQHRMLALCT